MRGRRGSPSTGNAGTSRNSGNGTVPRRPCSDHQEAGIEVTAWSSSAVSSRSGCCVGVGTAGTSARPRSSACSNCFARERDRRTEYSKTTSAGVIPGHFPSARSDLRAAVPAPAVGEIHESLEDPPPCTAADLPSPEWARKYVAVRSFSACFAKGPTSAAASDSVKKELTIKISTRYLLLGT